MKNESETIVESPAVASRPSAVVAWLLASRPKTLPAAITPVIVALALAARDLGAENLKLVPAACALAFAALAQIAANFINDYADFVKGADGKERKGPARAVASGWITPRAMLIGTFATLALACCFGLATIPYGGYKLIAVGATCCLFCVLYSLGPKPLAYIGLGDVLVILFFGLVAVVFTYYLQTRTITWDALLLGISLGFASDNILVANNYRDCDEDRANGKRTLIAIFGRRFGLAAYMANGLIAVGMIALLFSRNRHWTAVAVAAAVLYLFAHISVWRAMLRAREPRELIRILALSSRNLLILGVLVAVALVS